MHNSHKIPKDDVTTCALLKDLYPSVYKYIHIPMHVVTVNNQNHYIGSSLSRYTPTHTTKNSVQPVVEIEGVAARLLQHKHLYRPGTTQYFPPIIGSIIPVKHKMTNEPVRLYTVLRKRKPYHLCGVWVGVIDSLFLSKQKNKFFKPRWMTQS
tara:strand:- start:11 stop:469 length:459 start_codon:yes stop_codon:yes gene_type:complete